MKFFIIFLIVISLIIATNYYVSNNYLSNQFQKQKNQTFNRAEETLQLIDTNYQLLGQNMEHYLKKGLEQLINNGQLIKNNLTQVKKEYGISTIDIIKAGSIVQSTNQQHKGVDVYSSASVTEDKKEEKKQQEVTVYDFLTESYKEYLQRIKKEGQFHSRGLMLEKETNKLIKYAYLVSPDQKYIIRGKWYLQEFKNQYDEINVKSLDQIGQNSKLIKDVKLLAAHNLNNSQLPKSHKKILQKRMIKPLQNNKQLNKKVIEINGKNDIKYTYKYAPLDSMLGSRIIQIVSDAGYYADKMNNLQLLNLLLLSLGLAATFFTAYIVGSDISSSINNLSQKVLEFGTGNLNVNFDIEADNELGEMGKVLNRMKNDLEESISELITTAEDLSAYSQELSASAQQGDASVGETVNLITEIGSNITEVSAATEQVSKLAEMTTNKTESGSKYIKESVENMQAISSEVEETLVTIDELEKTSEEIDQIVEIINNIAKETNLLALNASIEAARAGSTIEGAANSSQKRKSGQGFTVVAEEIKELAGQTSASTENITQLINKVQEKIDIVLNSINQVTDKIRQGEEIIANTEEVFLEINDSNQEVAEEIEQTAQAVQILNKNSEEVINAVNEIKSMSEGVANSSEELAEMAQKLTNIADKFKTN